MIEIRTIRLELQQKKDNLLYADFRVVNKRLKDFLNFINDTPILKREIESIPTSNIQLEEWEKSLWNATDYGFPEEEDQTARMCYDILNRYKGQKLIDISRNFYTTSSTKITDHVQSYLETFVPFLYEYLDKRLINAETLITPIDIIKDTQELVDSETLKKFPEINRRMNNAYRKLYSAETNDDYKGVANICRGIIIDFTSSIFKEEFVPINVKVPQEDNAKDKLKYTYRHFAKKKNSQFKKGREQTILGTWEMIASTVHRKNIQEYEIKECILFTYLIIKAFIDVQQASEEN
jgi:hypothetical protein